MALSPLPSFAGVIVAAGKGLRAGGTVPKQFRDWRGKPMLRHSVEALIEAGAAPVMVLVAQDMHDEARAALDDGGPYRLVTGGDTRQSSVRAGLEALASEAPRRVLIHDAARPDLPRSVVERLLVALDHHSGVIPVLPVVDSLVATEAGDTMHDSIDRERLRRVQTPQAFRFDAILAAHRAWTGPFDAGDDAQVFHADGGTVALVEGDERLKKVTFAADLAEPKPLPPIRIGQGFDVHRLVRGEELWLCGVQLNHEFGLAGHSDADVALHAVTDAVLGAIGAGDIGTHFPPSDARWKGARSGEFLRHAVRLAHDGGYSIANVDLTIICEQPKIGPHRNAMRAELANLAGIDKAMVSIKATTTEGLGFTGRGEGMAAQATALLVLAKEE